MPALNMQEKTEKQEVKVDNTAVAKQHIEMVLNHAQKLGAEGKMVLCSYGEDPETGVKLNSHIVHLTICEDNSEKINKFIEYVETTPHSNGYIGLQVFDDSLPPGKRGTKKDILYMVGMGTDLDKLNGNGWESKMVDGLDPSYVVESSPGNFQPTFLFSELVKPDDCKKPFSAMCNAMADDHGTKDVAHVWRIPGLLNRVNAKKAKQGRKDSDSNLVLENGPKWTIEEVWKKVKPFHVVEKTNTGWVGVEPTLAVDELRELAEIYDPEDYNNCFVLERDEDSEDDSSTVDSDAIKMLADIYIALDHEPDPETINDALLNSPFYRPKFDEMRGDTTYLAYSIGTRIKAAKKRAEKEGWWNEPKAIDSEAITKIRAKLSKPDYGLKAKEWLEKDAKRSGDLNLSLLPMALQDHIKDCLKRADIHPLMILNGAIGAASAAIGKKIGFTGWYGARKLKCNLYTLLIAPSGTGKTTALDMTMKDVRRITREMEKNIRDEEAKKDPDLDLIAVCKQKLLIIPEDITMQFLIQILNEQGGAIPCSEFGAFAKKLQGGANAFGMLETLTHLYDGVEFRKGTMQGGLVYVPEPYLSICGFSTLEFLKNEMSKADIGSGALARYLFFYPQTVDLGPPTMPKILPSLPEMTVYEYLTYMDPIDMTWSDEVLRIHEEWMSTIYYDMKAYSEQAGEFLKPFIRRWNEHAVKLAMIFQQLKKVGSDTIESEAIIFQQLKKVGSDTIEPEAMIAAHHVVDLAIESTKLLFDDKLGISQFQAKCNQILNYIAKRGGIVSRQKILASRIMDGKKELDPVLETLIESGQLGSSTGKTLTGKTDLWFS